MWSEKHDCCQSCGTVKTSHQGHGFCRNCYTKMWRKDNPESVKKTREKYNSKPETKKKRQEYRQSERGRESSRERSKKYKERHPERVKEIQKRWRDKNHDHIKEYNERPEIKLRNRRTTLIKKYGSNALLVLDRDNNKCQKCGKIDPQVHHIDWDHENDDLDNMIILCNSCHKSLHAWSPKRLRRQIFLEWMETQ